MLVSISWSSDVQWMRRFPPASNTCQSPPEPALPTNTGQHNSVMAATGWAPMSMHLPDYEPICHPGLKRGCKSSWCLHPCAVGAHGRSGCRTRLRTDRSQTNADRCSPRRAWPLPPASCQHIRGEKIGSDSIYSTFRDLPLG